MLHITCFSNEKPSGLKRRLSIKMSLKSQLDECLSSARLKIVTNIPISARQASFDMFDTLISKYGPPVEKYPVWHPLYIISQHHGDILDHTVFLRDAIISSPYMPESKLEDRLPNICDILYSKAKIEVPWGRGALQHFPVSLGDLYDLNYEIIKDVHFWDIEACSFVLSVSTIEHPSKVATIPFTEQLLDITKTAGCAEPWKWMHEYFLGMPSTQTSSAFVAPETIKLMRKIYETVVEAKWFGERFSESQE